MTKQTKLTKQGSLVACGVLALALAAGTPAAAAEPTPSPASGEAPMASKTQTSHATAMVTAVDKSARKLTIKRPDGEKTAIQVPADVTGFDKLKVGDKIDVDYTE